MPRVAAADGPVLFEDADRLGFDDNALFHVINSVRENGTSLLITSRLWPMSWPVVTARSALAPEGCDRRRDRRTR